MTKFVFELINSTEVIIRGRVIQTFSEIEGSLARIMIASEMENLAKDPIDFRNIQLAKKITGACESLKVYHPELHTQYWALFSKLQEFVEFRNRIAHSEFEWNEKDLSYFYIFDISEVEGKRSVYNPVRYTGQEVLDILQLLNNILNELVCIFLRVYEKFNQKYPGAIDLKLEKAIY